MGLFLSVIVIYVSVIEFLTVYSHFRRSLQQSPSSRDMFPLIRRCEEGLYRERRRIINILERYKGPQTLSGKNIQKDKAIPAVSDLDINLKQNESPFSIPLVTCKDICNNTIWNNPTESSILEIKSTDCFSNPVLFEGSSGSAIKTSGKRVKFGVSIDEDQRYRFRSPSISQITNSFNNSKSKSLDNNYLTKNEALTQFSRFNESVSSDLTPEEEAWNVHKKTLSSDEDENKPFYEFDFLQTLDGIKSKNYSRESLVQDLQTNSEAAWNPDKTVVSSDESSECNRTEASRTSKKSRLFRKKKLRNSSLEVKLNNIEVLSSSECENNIVENVNQNVVLDEVTKEDNSPENAFWLIFSGEYTKAMNKDWHGQHFCCWQCDESLTGQRYVLRDEHPYCVACYESVFANSCEKCSRIIGIDSKDLSYKDKHWHEACFLCATCGDSLVDKQFGSKGERIYCGRCYDEQFASRCDGCGQIFRAGTKKMEYKTRQWHEKCFCCNVCKVPIGTQSFIPREQEIYCAKCYEEKYATRCIKCNKVITSGGVTYKNEPWHRECFTCTHCNTSLAGARFTSRDDKPYCAECFGELFAKRCTACNKPITGIGGTKFISFEDRHWHNDCFFCASCRTSLVGRGFITDADDIICPDCAKKNLM